MAEYSRNITDAELEAIKETGGVVGIMAYPPYLRRFSAVSAGLKMMET